MRLGRTKLVGSAVLVGLLAAGAVWLVRLQPRYLTAAARPVADLRPAGRSTPGPPMSCPWAWLSDREVLVMSSWPPDWPTVPPPTRLQAVDVRTRAACYLDRVAQRIDAWQQGHRPVCYGHMLPSPDGRWILWHPEMSWRDTAVATTVDGERLLEWPIVKAGSFRNPVGWLPDSTGFIRYSYPVTGVGLDGQTICRMGAPGPGTRTTLPANVVGGDYLGCTADGRALICNDQGDWTVTGSKAAYFASLDVARPQSPMRTYAVRPPARHRIAHVALSPRGDRLAWVLTAWFTPPPAWRVRLDNLLHMSRSTMDLELWTSRPDGKEWRKVGGIRPVKWQGDREQCRWSPDGRHIAFTCLGRLYVTTAD